MEFPWFTCMVCIISSINRAQIGLERGLLIQLGFVFPSVNTALLKHFYVIMQSTDFLAVKALLLPQNASIIPNS